MQVVLIAEIELAVEDDWVRPAFAVLGLDLELTLQVVLFRSRFDQRHDAVLVTEVKMSVRRDNCR